MYGLPDKNDVRESGSFILIAQSEDVVHHVGKAHGRSTHICGKGSLHLANQEAERRNSGAQWSSFPFLLTPGLRSWPGTTHALSVCYPSQLILFGNVHRGSHKGMPSARLSQVSLKSDITLYNQSIRPLEAGRMLCTSVRL